MNAAARALPWRALAALLVLALALRVLVIVAPPDDLFERGGMPQEECLRGIAAWEILRGPLVPLQDYQINHFWGGSLVVSLLAAPLFALAGPKVIALRLVSIPFALCAVLLVFVWLDRCASRRAAWIGAALLAFAPPGYALVGSTVYGTHMESNTLALLLAWLYCEWRAHGRGSARRTFVFGLSSGFSVWFGYGLLVPLVVVAALEFCSDKLFFARRAFWPWIGGFALGFVPWITYGVGRGFDAPKIYDTTLAGHFVIGLTQGTSIDIEGTRRITPVDKVFDLFARDVAESFYFLRAGEVDGLWIGRAVLCVLLALALVAALGARAQVWALARALLGRANAPPPTPVVFAGVFCALFVVAWAASDFAIGPRHWAQNFRYMMPLVPFLLVLAALGADRAIAHGGLARVGARAAAAALVLVCALGTLAHVRPERTREHLAAEANSLAWNARFLVLRFGDDPRAVEEIVERIVAKRDPVEASALLAAFEKGVRILAERPASAERGGAERTAALRSSAEILARANAARDR